MLSSSCVAYNNFHIISDYFFNHHPPLSSLLIITSIITILLLLTFAKMRNPKTEVYLVDFSCFKPHHSRLFTTQMLIQRAERLGHLSQENLRFMRRMMERSGLGPKTYVAESVTNIPPNPCLREAWKEMEAVVFGAIDEVLEKTRIDAKEIGILIVNCSVFSPVPSLCDMIVNRYKLRDGVLSYNLSGMGCSAGVLAVHFAQHLLQSHPNSYALVISTESGTAGTYWGTNPSMLLTNCLFRMGASASLLSNHPSHRHHSKYRLVHTLRTHIGASDKAHSCVLQQEDEQDHIGTMLSRDLMNVASEALKTHITSLAPLVLPFSEKLKFVANFVGKKLLGSKNIEDYVLNFKSCFEHFCIHTGGKAVLDEMQERLVLGDWDMEPSRMTLYKFGNTSSSSVWYELAYCEAKGRIKKGDRIWQLGFGSGFKCNSAVWVALDDIDGIEASKKSPWKDDIHEFPINN